jgi:hypothetical protein
VMNVRMKYCTTTYMREEAPCTWPDGEPGPVSHVNGVCRKWGRGPLPYISVSCTHQNGRWSMSNLCAYTVQHYAPCRLRQQAPVHQLSSFKLSRFSLVSSSKNWDNSMKYIIIILSKILAYSDLRITFLSL